MDKIGEFKYNEEDFKKYLDSNNFEYTKRKDGFPNMKYKNIQKMYDLHKSLKYMEYMQENMNNVKKRIDIPDKPR